MTIDGSCLCGNVNFAINSDKLPEAVFCHCLNCRTSSSALSFNACVPKPQFEWTKGTPNVYKDLATTSGKPVLRHFCGNCGSALLSIVTADDSTYYVKVGAIKGAENIKAIGQASNKDALSPLKDFSNVKKLD